MTGIERHIAAVRRFNRFYTRRIGALAHGHLGSPFSLAEVRVLYELAHANQPTASMLGKELGLDAGYLSRMLGAFARRGYLRRDASSEDARRRDLRLTAKGRKALAVLETRARREIGGVLRPLTPAAQRRLLDALQTTERLLAPSLPAQRERGDNYALRPHRPGDMGWVVHRHGVLYHEEYGFDERFEALVARIVADFIQKLDVTRERCWIAERNGEIVGSVFLVSRSRRVAKLRLLLVEPSARGLGIGKRLVDECIRFARQAGYRTLTLWTQANLVAAREIYQRAGFRLVRHERHRSFGPPLVAEVWELDLRTPRLPVRLPASGSRPRRAPPRSRRR